MAEQQTVRSTSAEIRDLFGEWLATEWAAGARLVIIEGLMGAGKSKLTERAFVLGTQPSTSIMLDDFLDKPIPEDTEYMDAINIERTRTNIMAALESAPLVIVEGPMAWLVVQRVFPEIASDEVRRVYLKRMSSIRPDDWDDLEFVQEHERPTVYTRSIDRYHVTERPWLQADLILERVPEAGE